MKNILSPVLVIVTIVVVAGLCLFFYVQGKDDANTNLNQRIGELVVQVADLKDQKTKDDAEHIKTEVALELERATRTKSEAKVSTLEAANSKLLADNASYREQLKHWDDRVVATEMAKHIGTDEVVAELRGAWHFSLTRIGGERTLGLFNDAETNFTLAENRKLQLIEKDSQIASLHVSVELKTVETKRESDGRAEALKKLDEAVVLITDQKKLLRRKKMEQFLKGTAVGIIIAETIYALTRR